MTFSIKDQVTLITGGGSGLGETTARYFARQGAKVCLVGRRVQDLDRVSNSLRQEGYFCESFTCVPTDEKAVAELYIQILQVAGPITTVINNAELSEIEFNSDTSAEAWPMRVAENLNSSIIFAKEAFRVLKPRGGNIINVCALSGVPISEKFDGYPAFSVSRAALIEFTEALASAGEKFKIRVNVIAPAESKNSAVTHDPKLSGDAEIAKVIYYLADPEDRETWNGTVIQVPSHV